MIVKKTEKLVGLTIEFDNGEVMEISGIKLLTYIGEYTTVRLEIINHKMAHIVLMDQEELMEKINQIYLMELHDSHLVGDISVFRVPGGWIYYQEDNTNDGTFVPFNNEFMPAERPYDPMYGMGEQ